jgi:hypothetical protein
VGFLLHLSQIIRQAIYQLMSLLPELFGIVGVV